MRDGGYAAGRRNGLHLPQFASCPAFLGSFTQPNVYMILALGYASAVLIGILLGLMGGGGAVIVVPVLVYLFHKDAVTATAYSLFMK